MKHNYLHKVSYYALEGLTNLLTLDLSENPYLIYFSALLLPGLSNLRYLDLSGTMLLRYLGDQFYLPNLVSLSFTHRIYYFPNYIPFIWPDTLTHAFSLERIYFDNSLLELENLLDISTNRSFFNGMDHLIYLNLSRNDLPTLPNGLFPNLRMLREIDLSYCKISTIQFGIFTTLESLQRLYLHNNFISQIPRVFNTVMARLELLYLHSNMLEFLEEDLFLNTPNLTNLTLSGNQLTVFLEGSFAPIKSSLKSIDLSDNPIQCSCQIQWLVSWGKTPIHIHRANQTLCGPTSDVLFRLTPLFTINPSKLCVSSFVCLLLVAFYRPLAIGHCIRLILQEMVDQVQGVSAQTGNRWL